MEDPRLEEIGQWGDITAWKVDGSIVRSYYDEDFTNFGQHYRFDFIPENEFWLDSEAGDDEHLFYIDHLLIEHRLMAQGMNYKKAITIADKHELRMRRKAHGVVVGIRKPNPELLSELRLKSLGISLYGLHVWKVDGDLVRDNFDIDFTEGGHWRVYKYVPKGEVWIDDDLFDDEEPYVILHELSEELKMGKGLKYLKAHSEISKVELMCRHNPELLSGELEKVGWKTNE